MLNYTWTDDYSVGNIVLDDHHKNLLNLFNGAYDLIINDKPAEQTIKLISELKVYSIFHFNEEEKLMENAQFPYLAEHKIEHQKFIAEVEKFKNQIGGNTRDLNEEIFIFLSDWLIKHIQKTDKLYMDYVNQ